MCTPAPADHCFSARMRAFRLLIIACIPHLALAALRRASHMLLGAHTQRNGDALCLPLAWCAWTHRFVAAGAFAPTKHASADFLGSPTRAAGPFTTCLRGRQGPEPTTRNNTRNILRSALRGATRKQVSFFRARLPGTPPQPRQLASLNGTLFAFCVGGLSRCNGCLLKKAESLGCHD